MSNIIEVEMEDDGRWIADMPSLPGAMAYGTTQAEAIAKVEALAFSVVANSMEEAPDHTGSTYEVWKQADRGEFINAFDDDEEIGPKMLRRFARVTGVEFDPEP